VEKNQQDIFISLITNKDFRDWIMEPNAERSYFWSKWIIEHPNAADDVKKAREFIQRLSFKKNLPAESELDELLGKILANEKTTFQHESFLAHKKMFYLSTKWIKLIAALLILVLSATLAHRYQSSLDAAPATEISWKSVVTPKGKRAKITLPDGTVVNLNAASKLKYPRNFQASDRKVELAGEAFFDVTTNDHKPFKVEVNGMEAIVLGTSFNVKSLSDNLTTEISLVSGKLRVKEISASSASHNIILTPGEQVSYDHASEKMVKRKFDIARTIDWKDGVLHFEDVGFQDFIDRVGAWYGVDFQVYGTIPKAWRINGRYQNEKLENVLLGLKFVYGIEYKIEGRNVTLIVKTTHK